MPVPQQIDMLSQLGMDYAPLAPGISRGRVTGFEGVPGFSPGSPFAMATPVLAPHLADAMGRVGMIPFGVGHDQNVYDTMARMRTTQMQIRAMQLAAQQEASNYAQSWRGVLALHGVPYGPEQRRQANTIGRGVATLAPFLADFNPELLDQLAGTGGSGVVFARRAMDAAKYRIDPVTGTMGMSPESVDAGTRQLLQELRLAGSSRRLQGVTLGQLGSLTQELQARGMLAGAGASASATPGMDPADPRSAIAAVVGDMMRNDLPGLRAAALRQGVRMPGDMPAHLGAMMTAGGPGAFGGLAGLTGYGQFSSRDLDRLGNDPSVSEGIRNVDAGRIRRSLEGYLKAVSAVKDIFGDAGHPNAPMQQIMGALEALTAGSMSQIDPNRLGAMVRQTHVLSQQTGMTVDGALALQRHAGMRASAMGLEPIFSVHAAQGAMAFGGAYRGQGHGAFPAWGAMSADQLQQLDANLRVQASASGLANQHNVAMRIRDTMGGFAPGTAAHAYTEAIAMGVNQFTDPRTGRAMNTYMNQGEFLQMMSSATRGDGQALGLSANAVLGLLSQRPANREYGERYRTGDLTRRDQTFQVNQFVGERLAYVFGNGFQGHASEAASMAAARAIGNRVANRITSDISTETFSSTTSRNDAIAGLIEQELAATGNGSLLAGMGDTQRRDFLRRLSEQAYGHVDSSVRTSQYRGLGGFQNLHRAYNATTLAGTDQQMLQANLAGRMREAMAPLGRGTLLSRAVDALQGVDINDPNGLLRVFSQSIGGVHGRTIGQAAMSELSTIRQEQQRVRDLQQELRTTTNPARRRELMGQLSVAERQLNQQATQLADIAAQNGVYGDDGVSGDALDRTGRDLSSLQSMSRDLIGMRGYFGAEVSDVERNAILGSRQGTALTQQEALAMVTARRTTELDALRARQFGNVSAATLGAFNSIKEGLQRTHPGMNEEQIHAAALRTLQNQPISQAMVAGITGAGAMLTDRSAVGRAELDALARLHRRSIPATAPAEVVDQILREHPGITREEAQRRADARQRASRLGIGWDEVNQRMRRDNSTVEGALDSIFAERADRRWQGTPAEVAARSREIRSQFTAFWASEEGQRMRETVQSTLEGMDSLAASIVGGTGSSRFGMQAVEMHQAVRQGQGRLYDLARQYAGGDVGRLIMGDLNADIGRDEANRVLAEKDSIIGQFQSVRERLQGQDGVPGRDWLPTTQNAAARQRLGLPADNLTEAQRRVMQNARRELGSETNARRMLGLAPDAELSNWQRARVAGLRFGAGNDMQIAAMLGEGRWGLMNEAERARVRGRMTAGGLSAADAAALLGVNPATMNASQRAEFDQQAEALRLGLATDAHARQLLVLGGNLNPSRNDMVGARYGLASERYARLMRGLPDDPLSAAQHTQLDRELGREAAASSARRLLGITGDVPADRRQEYDALVTNLENARRLSPTQERFVLANAGNPQNLQPIAAALNISTDALVAAANAGQRVQTYVGQYASNSSRPGRDVVRDIFRSFGYQGASESDAASLGALFDTSRGRLFGSALLRHQGNLQRFAQTGNLGEGLAGVDALLRGYNEIQALPAGEARDRRMDEFRRRHGITDLRELTDAISFQQSAGLLDVGMGPGRSRQAMSDLTARLRSGASEPAAAGPANQANTPVQIQGRLQIDLFGGFGDLIATIGSSLNHVAPPN